MLQRLGEVRVSSPVQWWANWELLQQNLIVQCEEISLIVILNFKNRSQKPFNKIRFWQNSYIVSCEKHRNAVLLFPEYFQKLANYLQDDLYVLQLSIYHVLVVPAATFTACSVDEIAPILYSALRKFAPKATVLGTSIYKFDRTEGNFSTIIK